MATHREPANVVTNFVTRPDERKFALRDQPANSLERKPAGRSGVAKLRRQVARGFAGRQVVFRFRHVRRVPAKVPDRVTFAACLPTPSLLERRTFAAH